MLKNRWWWTLVEQPPEDNWEDIHLVWVQFRRMEYVKAMKSVPQDLVKERIRHGGETQLLLQQPLSTIEGIITQPQHSPKAQ
jgi:hypothetical protein